MVARLLGHLHMPHRSYFESLFGENSARGGTHLQFALPTSEDFRASSHSRCSC